MTVKELIDLLKDVPGDVVVRADSAGKTEWLYLQGKHRDGMFRHGIILIKCDEEEE